LEAGKVHMRVACCFGVLVRLHSLLGSAEQLGHEWKERMRHGVEVGWGLKMMLELVGMLLSLREATCEKERLGVMAEEFHHLRI